MLVDVMIIISQLAVVEEELAGKRICLVFSAGKAGGWAIRFMAACFRTLPQSSNISGQMVSWYFAPNLSPL